MPFDFERRRVSVAAERDGAQTLICKGAPESVLAACAWWQTPEGIRALDAAARTRCEDTDSQVASYTACIPLPLPHHHPGCDIRAI